MKKLSYLSVVVVFLALTTLVCDKSPMTEQSVLGSAAQEKTLSKASNGIPFQGVSNENLVESLVVNGKFGVKNPESGLFTMAVLNDNVGIGTTTPTEKLHVVGNVFLQGQVRLGNTFLSGVNALVIADPGQGEGISWGAQEISVYTLTQGGVNAFQFDTISGFPFAFIGGNVGIGTTTPGSALEVVGLANAIRFRINIGDSPGLPGYSAQYDATTGMHFPGSNQLGFSTGGSSRMFIDASGDVGIGTNNPQGRLDVNGTIFQRGGQLHADYVFEPEYELETLEEHADFMWQNKHLKAIPKAKMDEHGREIVEVGAHRKGIVEELEKAHIYIEQLNQRLKAMEKKLASLEVGDNIDR